MCIGDRYSVVENDGYEMYSPMEKVTSEKDIGAAIDNKLSFSGHLTEKSIKQTRLWA